MDYDDVSSKEMEEMFEKMGVMTNRKISGRLGAEALYGP